MTKAKNEHRKKRTIKKKQAKKNVLSPTLRLLTHQHKEPPAVFSSLGLEGEDETRTDHDAVDMECIDGGERRLDNLLFTVFVAVGLAVDEGGHTDLLALVPFRLFLSGAVATRLHTRLALWHGRGTSGSRRGQRRRGRGRG